MPAHSPAFLRGRSLLNPRRLIVLLLFLFAATNLTLVINHTHGLGAHGGPGEERISASTEEGQEEDARPKSLARHDGVASASGGDVEEDEEDEASDAQEQQQQEQQEDDSSDQDGEGFIRAVPEEAMRPGGSEAKAYQHASAKARGCPHVRRSSHFRVKRTWLYRQPDAATVAKDPEAAPPRYAHMAMVEVLGNGTLVAAWQTSDTREGERDQHFVLCGNLPADNSFGDGGGEPRGGPELGVAPGVAPGKPAEGCHRLKHVGGRGAAIWGPVLYAEPFAKGTRIYDDTSPRETKRLWLFFSESGRSSPCPGRPMEWAPGGDIRATTYDTATRTWSEPRTLLSQSTDGGIPKVTANKPCVLSTGEWLLPFWRERSMLSTKGPECDRQRGRESAGVLISTDGGDTWKYNEPIVAKGTWLIENAIAEGKEPGSAVMVFRTQAGVVYITTSASRGESWTRPRPLTVPNPNSKIDMIRLRPSGDLLLAYNDHKRPMLMRRPISGEWGGIPPDMDKMDKMPIVGECKKCRSHLRLAISRDGGASFQRVASLEEEVDSPHELRISYPTLAQRGCDVFVAYSKLYTRQDLVAQEEERERKGIKVRMSRDNDVPRVFRANQGIVLAKVTIPT
ncbi:sialidase [Pycnococcus provasolii]